MDFVFLAGDFKAVQSARRQLLSHGDPMGAMWVQKLLYGADYRMQRDAKCLIYKVSS